MGIRRAQALVGSLVSCTIESATLLIAVSDSSAVGSVAGRGLAVFKRQVDQFNPRLDHGFGSRRDAAEPLAASELADDAQGLSGRVHSSAARADDLGLENAASDTIVDRAIRPLGHGQLLRSTCGTWFVEGNSLLIGSVGDLLLQKARTSWETVMALNSTSLSS